ncbi:restriction endonuclease subunit S (plasmid) [Flavobacterium sp. CBA20B-1]|uniref:restriction endonuclease subunit S n=1 Tax=unclassified Flavobacterium TaxID=196869 RepID=UPI00222530F7|nr:MULTISPECIES: restriction endonuclease subunit S [unclassified Flavobacterium]WCM43579.1 restriction endonuclease subunit S [Flavobacterium sp. CBA20B-1]
MSKLDELLQGVDIEWLPLDDIASFRRGSFPQPYGNSEWYDGEESMPFVQVNDVGFNMKLVEKTKNRISKKAQPKSIFVPENTVIVTLQGSIGRVAITQYDSYVDRTLAIFEKYKKEIDIKYFAYQLEAKFNIEKDRARGNIIKTITKEDFKKFQIPIPCPDNPEKSLEIQQEIVRVLDDLTSLTNQLTTELETERQSRKKQFEFFREQLFRFEEGEAEWKEIKDIFSIKRGKRLIKSELLNIGKYAVFQNSMKPLGFYNEYNVKSDTTFIISAGSAGEIGFSNNDFWAADDVYYFISPKNIINKFLFYFLLNNKYKIQKKVRRSSVPRLSRDSFEKILFPIPSLEEQERIVKLLDQFDATHTAIEEEISKEIKLRTQQYEYYREKLLSFPQN